MKGRKELFPEQKQKVREIGQLSGKKKERKLKGITSWDLFQLWLLIYCLSPARTVIWYPSQSWGCWRSTGSGKVKELVIWHHSQKNCLAEKLQFWEWHFSLALLNSHRSTGVFQANYYEKESRMFHRSNLAISKLPPPAQILIKLKKTTLNAESD